MVGDRDGCRNSEKRGASTATVFFFEQLKIATELGARGMLRPIQQVFAGDARIETLIYIYACAQTLTE